MKKFWKILITVEAGRWVHWVYFGKELRRNRDSERSKQKFPKNHSLYCIHKIRMGTRKKKKRLY